MISLFPFSFSFFLPIRIKYGVREFCDLSEVENF